MSEQKSKKALKLKTLEEIQNDAVYDIHIFPKKRRSPPTKSVEPVAPDEDDDVDDQVITDSDNGDESDDDMPGETNGKSITTTGQKRPKQRKVYISELLPVVLNDDASKSMITLSSYLMKKRKWPYRGWHKRFFILEKGYMIYAKSEQDIKRGRINGKCNIGLCIVTFIRESQRINIDETNRVYHLKIKEKKLFEQWLEQIALHRKYRQELLERQAPFIQNDDKQNNNENNLINNAVPSTDSIFYNDFTNIQAQLTNLSDILEHIKMNANNTTMSNSISKSTDGTKISGHTPSPSISSVNSYSFVDLQRQDYYDSAKKVFDNLNNLYKHLSVVALEQQQQQLNNSSLGDNDIYHSISPKASMSRHGSIFYDALEAHSVLMLNNDKDELAKLSESESSSSDEDESHAGELDRQISALHQLKPPKIKTKWRRSSLPAGAPDTTNVDNHGLLDDEQA
ncbi:unnamed protein product [Rotaria sp. Silwood2]|nr:unnamed protein product [Rotaria sp. Silwood2]